MGEQELTAWLSAPRAETGIRFAHRDGWDHWSYPRLAGLSQRFAAAYRALGVADGDVVALLLGTGPELVAALCGAAAVGAAAAPVAPPPLFGRPDEHTARIAGVLGAARPALVVTARRHHGLVGDLPALVAEEVAAGPPRHGDHPAVPHDPDRVALVQFTSGSSAAPRGIGVSGRALSSMLSTLGDWLGHAPDTVTASWLPLHHDMGLVGCLLSPVARQTDLWLMPAEEFVRRPTRYLDCFSAHGAALSAMPAFGLAHLCARVRPRDLVGADFSSWRVLIVGAERIDPDVLRRCQDLLGPHGFDPATFAPAYGLAEATLAVTGTPARRAWRSVTVDPATLVPGARVVRVPAGREVVGCGVPLGPARVGVVDDRGARVADGVVGEITVAGPAVTTGGVLRTGDTGFVLDGELFVLGRMGDAMKIRGRMVYAEELELAAGTPRPVVALGTRAGEPVLLAVVGATETTERVEHVHAVLDRLGEGAAVEVRRLPAARVPRTTSGKPRRRELFRRFLSGTFAT